MSTVDIRQKLLDYIEAAPDKKVEAIYTMVEGEIEEPYDHWEDEEFVAELLGRQKEFREGRVRTYSLEEVRKIVNETIDEVNAKRSVQS